MKIFLNGESPFGKLILVPMLTLGTVSCAKNNNVDINAAEDSSTSGMAASVVGGSLSSSSSGGTQASLTPAATPAAPSSLYASRDSLGNLISSAEASTACATFKTAAGSGCTAAGGTLWMTYNGCSFGTSSASWAGVQALSMSTGSATCGTFPNPGANNSLVRQFVTGASSTTPGTATRTAASGTVVTLDDATANLGNFNGDSVATLANGGYGTRVTVNASGARSGLTIARRVFSAGRFDHSVSGTLTVTEAVGAETRTVSGSVSVYHNLLKVVGTSTFENVAHSNTCCLPISGTITTQYVAGSHATPTTAGSKLVGKSETLKFTGCGTGTLSGPDGVSANITLNHCL